MHSRNPGYKSGDRWMSCPVCGFDYRSSDMKKRWDGIYVCKPDWEPRHPLDFVRTKPDREAPEGPVYPPSDNELAICTMEGRQGVVGVGVIGCAIVGLDYGYRS